MRRIFLSLSRPGKLPRVPQGVCRLLGYFRRECQQASQALYVDGVSHALQGVGQDLRGDGIAVGAQSGL